MATDLTALLKLCFGNQDTKKVEDVVKYVADTYVPKAEHDQLKMKVDKKDQHIKHLKDAVKEQSECAQSYWAMIEEKDKKLNCMMATVECLEYEGGVQQSDSSSGSSEGTDDIEIEVKTLADNVEITEKGIREAESELIAANEAVASYKKQLGLSKEAKLEEVNQKIDDMICENDQNYEELRYVKKQLEEKTDKVIHLTDKVQELTDDKECLTFQLEIKKNTLARTKSFIRSQRISQACDRYTSQGARHKQPSALSIRRIVPQQTWEQTCTKCKKVLSTIQYCEDCYQRVLGECYKPVN
jgi:chromosome segregation ATPase